MDKILLQLAAQSMSRILGAAVVVTGLYWMTVYNNGEGHLQNLAAINQELEQEEIKKKDTDATLKQVQEMKDKIGTLSTKYEEISKRLPESLFSIDLNKSIDVYAKESGVGVKNKRPGENKVGEVIEEVPVEVVIEGKYGQVAKFAYLVASAQRMSRLRDVVLSVATAEDTGSSKPAEMRLKLEGRVVGYKLAPTVAAPADGTATQETPQ